MVTVRIERRGCAPLELALEAESRLLDLCDEVSAPIAFGCRSADCGLCRVEVVRGAEWLAPAGPSERDVLRRLGDRPRLRLACQVAVLAGDGDVTLRPGG